MFWKCQWKSKKKWNWFLIILHLAPQIQNIIIFICDQYKEINQLLHTFFSLGTLVCIWHRVHLGLDQPCSRCSVCFFCDWKVQVGGGNPVNSAGVRWVQEERLTRAPKSHRPLNRNVASSFSVILTACFFESSLSGLLPLEPPSCHLNGLCLSLPSSVVHPRWGLTHLMRPNFTLASPQV